MNKNIVFILLFVSLLCFGCGKGKVHVSGKVAFPDGTPITKGTVHFTSPDYSVSGDIGRDGTYQVGERKNGDGIRPGRYVVRVHDVTMPDPKSRDKSRPDLLFVTDQEFSREVEVVKSMTLDLEVPRNPKLP